MVSNPKSELLTLLQSGNLASNLRKALEMLKAERFQLYSQIADDHLVGLVRSQSTDERVYSCRVTYDGEFSCCTQNLRPCGGLRGKLCKHILVLIVGLLNAEKLDPQKVKPWIEASLKKQPLLDKEVMSETFLQYHGAEAGDVDWRPTETVPEDYYAF